MGRPRKFDREQALMKAIEVFWSRGYEATTMTDLQQALGIGRQSLYATFGDKPQLFHEALERYVANGNSMLEAHFGPNAGVSEIRSYFRMAVHQLTQGETRLGCMTMNTCVERAPHDIGTAAITRSAVESLTHAFSIALSNGVAAGELDASLDVDSVAAVLMVQNAGLSVMARSGVSEAELQRIADIALDAILGR